MTTPLLGIAELTQTQNNKYITLNTGTRILEQGAQFFGNIIDKDLAAPPGSPVDGDAYIVAAGASGAWTGWANRIAIYSGTGWISITLGTKSRALAWVADESLQYQWSGTAWGVFSSYDFIGSCLLATTANITLSGEQTIDGTLTSASRVLVWKQTTGSQNGIYNTAAGAWTRAADFNISAEVSPGCVIPVESGTLYGDKLFMLTTNGPITLGSTTLTFSIIGGIGALFNVVEDTTPQLGGDLDGNTFEIILTNNKGYKAKTAAGVAKTLAIVTAADVATFGDASVATQILGSSINIGAATGTSFQGIIGNVTPAAGTFTTLTASGILSIDDTTDATSTTSASIHADGGIAAVKKGLFGTGVNVSAVVGFIQNYFGGNFTSNGGDAFANKQLFEGTLTGVSGDTTLLAGTQFSNSITTQSASQTIANVSQLYIVRPTITIGTDTITDAATVTITNAPTAGATNNALLIISGNLELRGGQFGYGVGAGGEVTQGAGSGKATGVTLSKQTGQITMNNAALAADAIVSFTLTNTKISANDYLHVQHISAGTVGAYNAVAVCASGSAVITVTNISTGSKSEAIVLKFSLLKSAIT